MEYAGATMAALDPRREHDLLAYGREVHAVLGDACVGVLLYGSAAGVDWVPGRSDFNTVIVLQHASPERLAALAPVVARWRPKGFALPVVFDREQVADAARLFPMELDDIRRQHRVLAGDNPFVGIATDEAALRRECAQEALGKLLRLRACYLEYAGDPPALGRMMTDSVKTFIIVVRHLLRLRGENVPQAYDAALAAGEAAVGPLPAMRQVLAQRHDQSPNAAHLRALAGDYGAEVERVVAAVVAYCG
jgi:hypothetical protein